MQWESVSGKRRRALGGTSTQGIMTRYVDLRKGRVRASPGSCVCREVAQVELMAWCRCVSEGGTSQNPRHDIRVLDDWHTRHCLVVVLVTVSSRDWAWIKGSMLPHGKCRRAECAAVGARTKPRILLGLGERQFWRGFPRRHCALKRYAVGSLMDLLCQDVKFLCIICPESTCAICSAMMGNP